MFRCLMLFIALWGYSLLAWAYQPFEVKAGGAVFYERPYKGQWVPLDYTPIKAPAKAQLKKIHQAYGTKVDVNSTLFTIEIPDLDSDITAAALEVEKKRMVLEDVDTFEASLEYLEAQHAYTQACHEVNRLKEAYGQTKTLVDLGGLPQEELDQQVHLLEKGRHHQALMRLRFEKLKKRVSKVSQNEAQLDYHKAQKQYDKLKQIKEALRIKAPLSGIIYAPALFQEKGAGQLLSQHETVESDQWLGVLAPEAAFGAVLILEERHLEDIEQADALMIQIKDSKVPARLVSIEPLQLQNQHEQSTRYQVTVRPNEAIKTKYRLGQRVQVWSHHKKKVAFKIPAKALFWHNQAPYVMLHDSAQTWQEKSVTLGMIGQDWVEIQNGITQGDTLGLPDSFG